MLKARWRRFIIAPLWLILSACNGRIGSDADIAPMAPLVVIPTSTATATSSPVTVTPTPALLIPIPVHDTIVLAADMLRPKLRPTQTPLPGPTATPTPVNWLQHVGRTEENLNYLGNPGAPVTMVDYSDFM